MKQSLSKQDVIGLFHELSNALEARSITGELYIVGGAAMMLAYNCRESTFDIDGVFHPTDDFRFLVKQICDAHNRSISKNCAYFIEEAISNVFGKEQK